ncbi:hypothetical protein ACJ73_05655, partial [Blastomyces percursus]
SFSTMLSISFHLFCSRICTLHKVLDLGCGAGWVTVQAASRVGPEGQVTAIDASGHCLRQASIAAKVSGVQKNVRLLKGDMRNLDRFAEEDPGFKGFDRILLLWVMQLVPPADQEQFLRHIATYLSPGGLIVFSQDHEHHELACIDALPFDGSDTDELHWLIGDARSFKQTRKFAEDQIRKAGLVQAKMEDCYRDGRYGYEDRATDIRRNADLAGQGDGGYSKECSRLYLECFKREQVTKIMEDRKKRKQNVAIKNVSVLIAAKRPNLEKGVNN